jgi:hypothetical protein
VTARAPNHRRALAILVAAISCAGCAAPAPTNGQPNAATPRTSPSPRSTPSGGTATAATLDVSIDPALLGILPDSVDGMKLGEARDAEAEAVGQSGLSEVATSLAATFAATPETGDFVYAVVVALRPGAMTEAKYRDWRDTFDEGACSQAGGVTGSAETELNGHKTFIGTCAGGLHTYHVWIPGAQRLVSISALGNRRLGEQLLRNLRDQGS